MDYQNSSGKPSGAWSQNRNGQGRAEMSEDGILGNTAHQSIESKYETLLDIESDNPSSPKKTIARPQRAHNSNKATTHQSWSDVMKSKPSDGSNGPLHPILKRSAHTLSLI
jgi:hypothetical protein